MKKYEFTDKEKVVAGKTLHQIRACISFGDVEVGKVGGWIEKEENLSHDGNAQIYGNAKIYGNAQICKQTHWLCIGPIGSPNGIATFFRTKGPKIFVEYGSFRGDIDAFAKKVQATHGESDHAKGAYMSAIELAKVCIDLSEENKNNS